MNRFSNKNTRNKSFPMNQEKKEIGPVCYAIGDIEGDINKLQYYDNFIKNHPKDDFVFIGDLFDDLSDNNCQKESNWSCIELICNNYLHEEIKFKRDEDESNDDKSIVSLPSAFEQIKFDRKSYNEINNRVKFVAGNSECDCLSDILYHCEFDSDGKYVFGSGKWKKTVTFERLCLLYHYLNNCNGVIALKNEKSTKNVPGFKNTIFFRHSIQKFKVNNNVSKKIDQKTNASDKDINEGNILFIAGHSKIFTCTGLLEDPNEDIYYIIDTSSIDPRRDKRSNREYPHDIRGHGSGDHRMAAIVFDEKHGYSVDVYPFKFKFKRWWKRYSFADSINLIKQYFSKLKVP